MHQRTDSIRCPVLLMTLLFLLITIGCALQERTPLVSKFRLSGVKTHRTLMPTPIGLTVGLSHPGGDFYQACQCAKDEIPVFVVSGRNIRNPSSAVDPFGNERSKIPHLGVAYLTVGENLTPEELHEQTVTSAKRKKAKVRFKRIELESKPVDIDPQRIKCDTSRLADNDWVRQMKSVMEQSGKRSVCVFVHGYNTDFIENTLLSAEIYHYLGRQGAVVSFEWPSESRLTGYIADKGNATYSTRHFRTMLTLLAKETGADSITIIAHSAGSPIVVNAMRELRLLEYDLNSQQLQAKYKLDKVVLAAPDMDVLEFVNGIHDRFYEAADSVAVYASSKDWALRFSEKVNGDYRLGRAVGELGQWESKVIGSIPQIQWIDATNADPSFKSVLGHGYFHRDPWVSSDIGSYMLGRCPQHRELVRQDGSLFWEFPDDYPERLRDSAPHSGLSADTSPAARHDLHATHGH